jgi:hypothetical protein
MGIAVFGLRILYVMGPFLSVGSLLWFSIVSDAPWFARLILVPLCFFGFGFTGMFAGAAACAIEDQRSRPQKEAAEQRRRLQALEDLADEVDDELDATMRENGMSVERLHRGARLAQLSDEIQRTIQAEDKGQRTAIRNRVR